MNKKITIALAVLLTFQLEGFTQQTWTLEECINHAMENNLTVRTKTLSSKISNHYKNQSLYNFLPGFEAAMDLTVRHGLDYNYYTSQYEDMDNKSSSVYIQGGITVFNGLQRYHEKLQRDYEYQQSKYEIEGYKHDLSLEIVRQYLQILYDSEMLEVMKEQLATAEIQYEAAKKRFDLGSISPTDYLEIKAQHAKSKSNLVETKNRLDLSTLSLAQLLELENPESFTIEFPERAQLAEQPNVKEDELFRSANDFYPHLKAREMYMKSREKNLLREYGRFSPTLSLYGRFYSRFSDLAISKTLNPGATYPEFSFVNQIDENLARDFGLRLSIPIFSRMQNYTSVNVARLDVKMAQLAVEQTKLDLNKTLRQSVADANAMFENYESLDLAAKAYDEAYKQSQKRFELGMISASEYGLAKANSLRANADLLHAKYNYILKIKILDFYRGVPISL